MVFALEEINRNNSLLPNITLGFWIYDSCDTPSQSLQGTMWQLTGHKDPIPNYTRRGRGASPLAAVIGDHKSRMSIAMAHLLGVYKQAQISYASSVVELSDKSRFPSFLRTTPSDEYQSLGIARLITFFKWTWVGILAEDNDYGQIGSQMLKQELVKVGVCVAFYETIPLFYSEKKIQHIVEVVKTTTARVIVVFSNANNLYPVMLAIAKSDISGKVWIASDGWADHPIFNEEEFLKALKGTISLSVPTGNIPKLKEYLYDLHPFRTTEDIFVAQFWEEAFGCRWADSIMNQTTYPELSKAWKLCTGKEDLRTLDIPFFDITNLRFTYNVYNAVYVVVNALHAMYSCEPGKGPFFNGSCGDIRHFEPWQLLHYIREVRFQNTMGREIFFDQKGNPPAAYDILNWHLPLSGSFSYVNIGHYDSGAAGSRDIKFNTSAIVWNEDNAQAPVSTCSESCGPGFRKAILEGQPACCFDCIPCSKDEFSNQTDATECMKCPDNQWPTKRHDGCQEKSIEFLSYQEPLGMTLAFISVLGALMPAAILVVFIKNRHTPLVKANNRELSYLLLLALILCFSCSLVFIGHPATPICMVRQIAFGVVFVICISCLLAKTIMVAIAFKATKPNSNLRSWVGPRLPKALVAFSCLVQILICVTWLIVAPPFSQMNMKSQMGKIILECNEGSVTAFWCMLGYMGLLSTISFIVAFLARKLPDSFNEAKFITFSMLIFIAVWISFIPAYLSTTGKYTVAVEIFAMLSSSAGLLGCIFFPKCYVILIRPEMNTKEFLMGKTTGNLKKGRSPLAAVIGDDKSRMSLTMAQLLGVYKHTQISYASSVAALSDKSRFPSFLRTTPSDEYQSLGIARLITFFGWTWVGILAEDNDYGQIGSQMLSEELIKAGVCIAFYETIPLFYSEGKMQRIVQVVQKTTANVIVVFSTANNLFPAMLAIAKNEAPASHLQRELWSWVPEGHSGGQPACCFDCVPCSEEEFSNKTVIVTELPKEKKEDILSCFWLLLADQVSGKAFKGQEGCTSGCIQGGPGAVRLKVQDLRGRRSSRVLRLLRAAMPAVAMDSSLTAFDTEGAQGADSQESRPGVSPLDPDPSFLQGTSLEGDYPKVVHLFHKEELSPLIPAVLEELGIEVPPQDSNLGAVDLVMVGLHGPANSFLFHSSVGALLFREWNTPDTCLKGDGQIVSIAQGGSRPAQGSQAGCCSFCSHQKDHHSGHQSSSFKGSSG
ncbi:vomeronasal type-2 receptor 1-like [Rhinatrema bivittatum]|uniref:vomeronasal type-2 receptor 1-like n=1 Tax=Rhinatrema bivittatum TaxID=194408 RepID=UPI0011279C40|nr:vomeronasal type-2 receptor 1-like [Rhinatrema bivittatum]